MSYRLSLLLTENDRLEHEKPPAGIGDTVGAQPGLEAEVSEELIPAPPLFERDLRKKDTGTAVQFYIYTVYAHLDLLR
jgi:hypothetical protein